jgi:hypothetical protein
MKKYLIFIFLILISCQKDELFVTTEVEQYDMIFESPISKVIDGHEFSFEVSTTEIHQLLVTYKNGSVITKESFMPIVGLNTKTIYTNTLPKGQLNLILQLNTTELMKTIIIVE